MTTKLLTARLDEGLIARFREKAKLEKRPMSEVLKALIEGYLEGSIDTKGEETAIKKLDDNLEDTIDNHLDTKLDTLLDGKLNTKLDTLLDSKLDTLIDSKLDENLDTKLDTLLDGKLNTKLDTLLDSKLDSVIDSKLDTLIDSKLDNHLDTHLDSHLEAFIDTKLDNHLEGKLDTLIDTKLDKSAIAAPQNENLEPLPENPPTESTLEPTKPTSQDESPSTTPEPLETAKTEDNPPVEVESKDFLKDSEESAIAEKECQVYLVQVTNNDKKPTKLIRGIDFSCENDDTTDLMEAIQDYLYNNDLIDPDDENVRIWDDPQLWKKANKSRGISRVQMAKRIGIARNTLEACMEGKASSKNENLYEDEVLPTYYWCHLTQRFYRR